jgi:hypothetical protein
MNRQVNWPGLRPMPAPVPQEPKLVFSPLAMLKLQLFMQADQVQIGGFGISSEDNPLYVEDFLTVRQRVTPASVELDKQALADLPKRPGRIWVQSHVNEYAHPTAADEQACRRALGSGDWSALCILARDGASYARLSFAAVPDLAVPLEIEVDWANWPEILLERGAELGELFEGWMDEYGQNILPAGQEFPRMCRNRRLVHAEWSEDRSYDLDPVPAWMDGMESDLGIGSRRRILGR